MYDFIYCYRLHLVLCFAVVFYLKYPPQDVQGGDQNDGVGGCGAHLPPRIHTNTSTCGSILTENKLETVRKTLLQPRL